MPDQITHSRNYQRLMEIFDGRFDRANSAELLLALSRDPLLIGEMLDSLAKGKGNLLYQNIFFLDALKQFIIYSRPNITIEQLGYLIAALRSLESDAGHARLELQILIDNFQRVRGTPEN